MPEARDRLSRPSDDVAEMYIRRRTSVGSLGILPDDDDSERSVNRTPFQWGATPLTGGDAGRLAAGTRSTRNTNGSIMRGGGGGRGLFGTPRTGFGRGSRSQNTPTPSGSFRRGRGGSQSVLPSWYPRTPLRDITHVVRAIERRRSRLGEGELGIPTTVRQQLTVPDPSSSGSRLEQGQESSLLTPKPTLTSKTYKPSTLGKVPKILADIANQGGGESEFLTPQKKLLNSIDVVEKVVMEELRRLKRTPSAKKAEREKRVRTLMSMR